MTFLKESMFAERPASVSVLALARVLSMSVSLFLACRDVHLNLHICALPE